MSHLRLHCTRGFVTPHSEAVAAMMRLDASAWGIEPVPLPPGEIGLTLWGCQLRLVDLNDMLQLEVSGPEKRLVDLLRDMVADVVARAGLTLRWDGADPDALPPGLSAATVLSITDRSPGFVRVRLTGPDLDRFAAPENLHVRLLLPPAGRAPVWPSLSQTGNLIWPTGADALHRAVHTVAAHGQWSPGWIDVDIFRHPDSVTCAWLAGDPVGATVGLQGPGWGGCPQADKLWLFGDETALPAIARMLRLAPGLVSATLRADRYDIGALACDARVNGCDDLLDALMAHEVSEGPVAGGHVWFAGRADQARAARAHLLSRNWARADISCAGYWR